MKYADYEFPNNSQEVMKLILRPVPIKTQQSKRKLAAKGKDADGIVAAAVSKKKKAKKLDWLDQEEDENMSEQELAHDDLVLLKLLLIHDVIAFSFLIVGFIDMYVCMYVCMYV